MTSLTEKEHFTASECADLWGVTVQDLLQHGAYGRLEIMVYLTLAEGILYVFRNGKGPREEIKRSSWIGFHILSPMVCRDLQVHSDEPCPVTSIEPEQSLKKDYDSSDILGIDLFQPIIETRKRKYQMVQYKDLWISFDEKQRFSTLVKNTEVTRKNSSTNNLLINRRKNHIPELHKIFWRAFISLKTQYKGNDPQYSETWNAVYYDCKLHLKDANPAKLKRRDYDTNEIIDFITMHDHPNPRIEWGTELDLGTYKLSSFKSLLTRLKSKPPF